MLGRCRLLRDRIVRDHEDWRALTRDRLTAAVPDRQGREDEKKGR